MRLEIADDLTGMLLADDEFYVPTSCEGPRRHGTRFSPSRPDALVTEIKKAHCERIMQYHPDRVAHLGEKLRVLAGQEAAAINDAYAQAMTARR